MGEQRADGGKTEPFWLSTTFLATGGAFIAAAVAFVAFLWPEGAQWLQGLAGQLIALGGAGLALAAFIWRAKKGSSAEHSSPRLTLGKPKAPFQDRPGGGVTGPLVILLAGSVLFLCSCSATTQGRIQTAEGAIGVAVFAADLAAEAAIHREEAALCVAAVSVQAAAEVAEDALRDLGDDVELDAIPGLTVQLGRCEELFPGGFPAMLEGDALLVVDGLAQRVLPAVRRYVDQLLSRVPDEEMSCRTRQAVRAALAYIEAAFLPAVDFLSGRSGSVVFPAVPIEYGECDAGVEEARRSGLLLESAAQWEG